MGTLEVKERSKESTNLEVKSMERERGRDYFVFTLEQVHPFENETPPLTTPFPLLSILTSSLSISGFRSDHGFLLKTMGFWIPFLFQSHCPLHHYFWPHRPIPTFLQLLESIGISVYPLPTSIH